MTKKNSKYPADNTEAEQVLSEKKLFLLDMDGTLYIDDYLFERVLDFLNYIKSRGGRYAFLTNNSSRGVETYISKMKNLGIDTCKEDYLTSVDALMVFLKEKYGKDAFKKKLYIMGTKSFKEQMKEEGFIIVENPFNDVCESQVEGKIDAVILGFDRELTFSKIEEVCILLKNDVDYFATNPDWVCPTSYGAVPDCGSFAWMIQKATGKSPKFIGKPEPDMALLAMKKYGFSSDQTVLIGDRLYTDIACGVNAGIDTIFVLSGEGTLQDLETSPAKPKLICKDVDEILRIMEH